MHVRFKIENIKFSLYISVSNTCISRYPKIVKRTHLDILIYQQLNILQSLILFYQTHAD